MKFQCGAIFRDPRISGRTQLERILGEFLRWKADTSSEWVTEGVVVAYRGDQITMEDAFDAQPVEIGPYVVTWDGRLDNRKAIAARAGLQTEAGHADSSLVAQAYARIGDAIIGEFIGEFALCIWCRKSGMLLLARSVCGSRPLFFVADENCILWSSDIAHLVRASNISPVVNDSYVLEYLFAQPRYSHSPFENVSPVSPGTLVKIQLGKPPAAQPFWSWEEIKPVRYKTDQEYEDHFLQVIREAVEVRLNTPRDIFCELSGGLDSSTIVCVADRLLEEQPQNNTKLNTVSCVYEESLDCDETPFIEEIARKRQCPGFYICEHEQVTTLGLDNIYFSGIPNPFHCFTGRYGQICELMRNSGARLLLTGYGGDHLFWSSSDGAPTIADELRRFRFRRAHRECILWSELTGTPYISLLFTKAIPLVFDSLNIRQRNHCVPSIPPWLPGKYRDKARDIAVEYIGRSVGVGSPGQRAQRRLAEDLFSTSSAGYFSEFRTLYVSHPYTHRPLVEFCTSIPVEQFTRNGETRSLMRRALTQILPERIRTRCDKPDLNGALARLLQKNWHQVGEVGNWRCCQRGYVFPEQLSHSLDQMRLGLELSKEPLLRVFTLERWLRSLECVHTCPNSSFVSAGPAEKVPLAV